MMTATSQLRVLECLLDRQGLRPEESGAGGGLPHLFEGRGKLTGAKPVPPCEVLNQAVWAHPPSVRAYRVASCATPDVRCTWSINKVEGILTRGDHTSLSPPSQVAELPSQTLMGHTTSCFASPYPSSVLLRASLLCGFHVHIDPHHVLTCIHPLPYPILVPQLCHHSFGH